MLFFVFVPFILSFVIPIIFHFFIFPTQDPNLHKQPEKWSRVVVYAEFERWKNKQSKMKNKRIERQMKKWNKR